MKKWGFMLSCVIFGLLAIFAHANSTAAQSVDPSDRVHDIAKRLNCPTCAGRNLSDCPTDTCLQWKQEIKSQIENGKTDAQVIAYFYDRFGSVVLQEPPREGLIWLVWILPVLGLVALAVGAVILLYKMRRVNQLAANTEGTSIADEYTQRLEEEIQA